MTSDFADWSATEGFEELPYSLAAFQQGEGSIVGCVAISHELLIERAQQTLIKGYLPSMYSPPRTRSEKQTLAPHGLRKNAIGDPTPLAHILRYLPIASRVMSRVHPSQIAVGRLSRQRYPPPDAPGPISAAQVRSQTFCRLGRKLHHT